MTILPRRIAIREFWG